MILPCYPLCTPFEKSLLRIIHPNIGFHIPPWMADVQEVFNLTTAESAKRSILYGSATIFCGLAPRNGSRKYTSRNTAPTAWLTIIPNYSCRSGHQCHKCRRGHYDLLHRDDWSSFPSCSWAYYTEVLATGVLASGENVPAEMTFNSWRQCRAAVFSSRLHLARSHCPLLFVYPFGRAIAVISETLWRKINTHLDGVDFGCKSGVS